MNDEILTVKNLNVYAPLRLGKSQTRILEGIHLSACQGDVVGLVGETGAGKSILINSIGCNLGPPLWWEAEELSIDINHQRESLLGKTEDELREIWGRQIMLIPSNAREGLNPTLTIGHQFSNILKAKFNISNREAYQKVIEMFELVRMPDPKYNFDNYPYELSGGMAQRVVISIALSMSPKLLLADEPTKGLDVTIQRQVLDLMAGLLKDFRFTIILATRDIGIVANYCNRVAVMCNGQLAEYAEARDFFKNAIHPYSHYLLEAAFASRTKKVQIQWKLATAKAEMESRKENSCRFVSRCHLAQEVCWSVRPTEKFISPTHYVRCHRWESK